MPSLPVTPPRLKHESERSCKSWRVRAHLSKRSAPSTCKPIMGQCGRGACHIYFLISLLLFGRALLLHQSRRNGNSLGRPTNIHACMRSPRRQCRTLLGLRDDNRRFRGILGHSGALSIMKRDGNSISMMMRSCAVGSAPLVGALPSAVSNQAVPPRMNALIVRALETQKGRSQDSGGDEGD